MHRLKMGRRSTWLDQYGQDGTQKSFAAANLPSGRKGGRPTGTRRRIAAAGVSRIRLHDLRHTHASLALAAGVNPKVVSERLGHATISITLDTYSQVIPAMQEDAAEKIARVVRLRD